MTLRELIATLARIPNFDAKVYVQTGEDEGTAYMPLLGVSQGQNPGEIYLHWVEEEEHG